ncbi:MAG: AraC family transcriptional regulator [Ginsengibacter sp.]
MYSLSLKHCFSSSFISQVAYSQHVERYDNEILLAPTFAKGYLKAFKLLNKLECIISDYTLKEDFHLHKFSLLREFFILRIDEIKHADNSVIMVDRQFDNQLNAKKYSLVFLSSLADFAFVAPKRSHVRSLEIFIPRNWLYKGLNLQRGEKKLAIFMGFKNRKSMADFITPSFIKQFKDIIIKSQQPDTIAFNEQINLLLENFFSFLDSRLHEVANEKKIKIANDEVRRLFEVKNYLVRDLSLQPDFLDLQYVAAMSGTTLKRKFKKMYGVTLYEYFQHMRMEKARILLRSNKYTVTEVGKQLGYINLSNFSIAFKKEFDQFPLRYLQEYQGHSMIAGKPTSFTTLKQLDKKESNSTLNQSKFKNT